MTSPTEQSATLPNAKRIFLSHASQDAAAAERLSEALEKAGFGCWIAPRDVPPGQPYSTAIVEAINGCSEVVLIFSRHAAVSQHVLREIERASSKARTVIPIRIDAAELPPSLEYFLSATQWIDHPSADIDRVVPRLIAAIDRKHSVLSSSSVVPKLSRKIRAPIVIGFVLLLLAALFWTLGRWPWTSLPSTSGARSVARTDRSVAVLPFLDLSEKKDQEYFADGIAEEISTRLAAIPHIRAVGHASVFQFKNSNKDLREIGDALGATYIVEGSVRRAQDKVRVTAKLIDAQAGTQLWADSFDSDYQDVLGTQQQIAIGIARALQLFVTAEEQAPAGRLKNPEAYALFLRGQSELDQMHQSSLFDAQSNFERALELDPTFLRAAESLAVTYISQAIDESLPPRTAFAKAKEAAERALRLDSDSAPAHAALAMVLALNDYELDAAEAQFSTVLAKHSRDPFALRSAALVAHARGRKEDALRLINEALAIDPFNPWNYSTKGQMLMMSGDLERAEVSFKKCNEISPLFDGARFYRAVILLLRGDLEAGRKVASEEVAENARDSGMSMAFFASGQTAQSDAAVTRLIQSSKDRWPTGISQAYAFRHDWPHTLQWIERAYELRDPDLITNMRGDHLYDGLRTDPRFMAVFHKMNLTD